MRSVLEARVTGRDPVFKTPWFELVRKTVENAASPHYSINTADYVSVFAVTPEGAFPLVRQFRPAIEKGTLELPSGHVDESETPELAVRRELCEETGFLANQVVLLGTLAPDTGRLGNRLWCFFAPNVSQTISPAFKAERGIEMILYRKPLRELLLAEPAFSSALNRAVILMAVAADYIKL